MTRRHVVQWLLLPIVPLTIGLGWKYPLIGFTVPAVMFAGMMGGFIRGRYVCGHFCPRGGFLDRLIKPLASWKAIPAWMRDMRLRWAIFALLVGFMIVRVLANPADIHHWGRVFWTMCTLTTGVAIVLAVLWRPRAWCAICPIGTFANAVGGHKHRLGMDAAACVGCTRCGRVCPMGLSAMVCKESGVLADRDCLKCGECVSSCPTKALGFRRRQSA